MNNGSNHPSAGSSAGRGHRRRRGQRGQGPTQHAGKQEDNRQQRQSGEQARSQHNNQQHKQRRPPKQRHPDAGIYSAPMDHSYRALQNGNGNGGKRGVDRKPGRYVRPFAIQPEPLSENYDGPPRIFAFVDDLFFLAKIQETARKLNVKVEFVKASDKGVIGRLEAAEEKPSLIIFDLNNLTPKPLLMIAKLRSKLKKATNIIGFVSHVQGELKVKAQEAGCDMVVPRSAFSQNLPQLLRRHAIPDNDQLKG